MIDKNRLAILLTSIPENEEQAKKRLALIKQLELKLGLHMRDSSMTVEHGDISDAGGYFTKKQ